MRFKRVYVEEISVCGGWGVSRVWRRLLIVQEGGDINSKDLTMYLRKTLTGKVRRFTTTPGMYDNIVSEERITTHRKIS